MLYSTASRLYNRRIRRWKHGILANLFCAAPKGRKELAEATGIPEKLVLKWTNHADMYRVRGIGPQFAELLEASGVDTVKELSHRVAANLAAKVAEVNAEKKLVGRVPVESELQKMIDEAKTLPGVITY